VLQSKLYVLLELPCSWTAWPTTRPYHEPIMCCIEPYDNNLWNVPFCCQVLQKEDFFLHILQ